MARGWFPIGLPSGQTAGLHSSKSLQSLTSMIDAFVDFCLNAQDPETRYLGNFSENSVTPRGMGRGLSTPPHLIYPVDLYLLLELIYQNRLPEVYFLPSIRKGKIFIFCDRWKKMQF